MKVKFDFENPLEVSSGDTPDRMVSKFTDPRLLVDPVTGMYVQTPGMITKLPKMLLSDNATEVLGASCFLVASATNTLIVVLVILAFSLVAMTKSIWQFINTIQLLAYMRWMVEWPANADMAYECLDYAVSGRVQTDMFWDLIRYSISGDLEETVPVSDLTKYPKFVDTPDHLPKALGIYPFIAVLIILAMIYTLILKKCKSKNLKMRRQYNSLNRKLYYNTLLRFALEIDLTLTHQAVSVVWFVGLASLQTTIIHGVFCLLMLFFPFAVMCFLLKSRQRLPDRKVKARYGTLYQGIKTDKKSTACYTAVFIFRRLMLVCLVVFFNDLKFFRPMIFLWMQVFYLIWVGWSKPHDESWYNFLDRLNEWGLICIGYVMFLQTAFMDDQVVKYIMGWAAIWICVVLYFFNFLSMLFVFCRELRHAYRMYSVKRKFILQYSRKGMIEQNYFKSSKDTGPKSKLSKKMASLGSSSRDEGSPRKERRRRRRRENAGKSELVAKNDIDDVIEAGDEYGHDDSQKYTREFMGKLRDAETAHKLQQIAEVDGEESDDGFGPVEHGGGGDYGQVSNRSSHRQGISSRDGGPRAMPLEQDDFFTPILEEQEEAADKSTTSKKKKKGKRKKKPKKSTILAVIGEDLDIPAESGDNAEDEDAGAKSPSNKEGIDSQQPSKEVNEAATNSQQHESLQEDAGFGAEADSAADGEQVDNNNAELNGAD